MKQFSIHPGDRVRLLTGKAVDKFTDETRKAAGGYKLYTVRETDPPRNRVMLEGLVVGSQLGWIMSRLTLIIAGGYAEPNLVSDTA